MRPSIPRLLTPLLLLAAALAAQDEAAAPTTASPEVLAALLERYAASVEEGQAFLVADVLEEMAAHDNPELLEVALEALDYEASKVDEASVRDLAEQLGETSKGEVERLLAVREAEVQAAAARLLGNLPDKAAQKALGKAFQDKKLRKDKPEVVAAAVDAHGRLGDASITEEVAKLLRVTLDPELSRACVRYFGQTGCRDYDIVCDLIRFLGPAPDVRTNNGVPDPGSQALREKWMRIGRDVSWALEQITGQFWEPAVGDEPGDRDAALEYVEEHKKELGLR